MDIACEIIDIRRSPTGDTILNDMESDLQKQPKQMPTLLLYDEKGLKLFEDITYLDEYYLTNAEIRVLQANADKIVNGIPSGAIMVELGSGNLRKVDILLKAFEKAGKNLDYYALDLSLPELQRTLREVRPDDFQHVKLRGLLGTYDDGLAWIQKPHNLSRPKCILSLGSSLGNLLPSEAGSFLREWGEVLTSTDSMLVGLDACCDPKKVYPAYNDKYGVTHEFLRNGLHHANQLLGKESFRIDDWDVLGRFNEDEVCHQAFYRPKKDISMGNIKFRTGELIKIEQSYKYSVARAKELWDSAGLIESATFGNGGDQHYLHLLHRDPGHFSVGGADKYVSEPAPRIGEWEHLWACWDHIILQMVPEDKLHTKPIDLRNEIIFYAGHIPTFLDIHISKATEDGPTQPESYRTIFERGIDPDIDDPTKCNPHSTIPKSWPEFAEILSFQSRVRERLTRLYADDANLQSPRIARALWLAFEHEALHIETLLYMLIQTEVRDPMGPSKPDFSELAVKDNGGATENRWFEIPESTITVGIDELETDVTVPPCFGWDNEKPAREVKVPAFQARARPISNEEYARYLTECGNTSNLPATWERISTGATNGHTLSNGANGVSKGTANGQLSNGNADKYAVSSVNDSQKHQAFISEISIRTFYGPIPLSQALHWPAMASYDELVGCAKWMGGRVPTADELRSVYHYADILKQREPSAVLAKKISAVNGHLSNNGVEETPPQTQHAVENGSKPKPSSPAAFFADLSQSNVGFTHWHPTSVTNAGGHLCGRGETGGAWEWTSSVLEAHDGFKPMPLYPGYTSDFFDGKHNIVLGGSWATHPRIAGRKSFVNWYQRAYRFAWVGARVVRDA